MFAMTLCNFTKYLVKSTLWFHILNTTFRYYVVLLIIHYSKSVYIAKFIIRKKI